MTDTILTDAFNTLMQEVTTSIKSVGTNSLDNDRALLKLGEILVQRVMELEMKNAELQHQFNQVNDKLNILHELYHTHFGDGLTKLDDDETKH